MSKVNALSFNNSKFSDFLNTAQSGSAQLSQGSTLRSLLASVIASLLFGLFEVLSFSLLRTRLSHIYQPLVSRSARNAKCLSTDLFSWITPVMVEHSINDYFHLGFNTYFFLRYLCILLRFFCVTAIFNNFILLPINYSGSSGRDEGGTFDVLSMSNISPAFASRYYFHFLVSLLVIHLLQFIIAEEMENYTVITRNAFRKRSLRNAVLINFLEPELQDEEILRSQFEKLPGGVKDVQFVFDTRELVTAIQKFERARDLLEAFEVQYLKRSMGISSTNTVLSIISSLKNFGRPTVLIPLNFLGLSIRVPLICQSKDAIVYYSEKVVALHENIIRLSDKLLTERIPCFGKVFVEFNSLISAHIANQIVLFESNQVLKGTELVTDPGDILWSNVTADMGFRYKCKVVTVRVVSIVVSIFWVVPVSAVGIIAQIPFLSRLIPLLGALNRLPFFLKQLLSGVLPTIALTGLTEMILWLLTALIALKGITTGYNYQLNLQKWIFAFLFCHVFLVVTISSGFTVIFENLINNPVSIPALLATDLPKASNFFHSFFVIRGTLYFGNTLLQPRALFLNYFWDPLRNTTPRRLGKGVGGGYEVSWGAIYPTISVLGCIGIVYSIISPLILIFCCLCFFLVSTGYKYNLLYVYIDKWEMNGKLYPNALLQLYSGIYCLELSLMGLFMLQGCWLLATSMSFVFSMSIISNVRLKQKYFKQAVPFITTSCNALTKDKSSCENKSLRTVSPLIGVYDLLAKLIPPLPDTSKTHTELDSLSDESLIFFFPEIPELSIWLPDNFDSTLPLEARKMVAKGFRIEVGNRYNRV